MIAAVTTRRSLLGGLGGAFLLGGAASAQSVEGEPVGAAWQPWRPGLLDIHVIATGRGDATLIVTPTGKTLLIDIGAAGGDPARMLSAAPNASQSSGAHVADYVRSQLAHTGGDALDVLLITHLHDDHVGGLADFAARVPIRRLIDPDFPDYGYPPFEGRAAIERYVGLVQARAKDGGRNERLIVGADKQFDLAPVWIRTLASRGIVWTGQGTESRNVFPPQARLAPANYPNENAMSAAVLVSFGAFRAFFGGDLSDWAEAGARSWMDALTPAARAAGLVDFAMAPHHGLYTASGPSAVAALQPQVWGISTWHETHPSPSTLARLLERRLNPRLQGVFLTGISPAAATLSARFIPQLTATSGHIIVRVRDDGHHFQAISVSADGQARITASTSVLMSGQR